jgi:capsular polysaccharide biosynthesis protein
MATGPEQVGARRWREIGTALRRFWWVALLVVVPLVGGAGLYASSLPDEYEVQSVVAFVPRDRPETGADLVELLLPKYAVYARSDQTLRRVAGRLDEDPEEVRESLHAVVPPDTAQLELTVDLGDARRSARLANALAEDVVRFARSDPVLAAAAITDAVPPEDPTGPNRLALVGAGALVALVAGLFAALVAHRRRAAVVSGARPQVARQEGPVRREPPRPRIPEASAT